jgi:DNA-binding response OmpR family regulator
MTRSLKIFIIDESKANIALITAALRKQSYDCEISSESNADAALMKLIEMSRNDKTLLPDIILIGKLDRALNAIAVLCYLNTANITEQSAAVVVCGYTDYNDRALYLNNGAAHVIAWRFDCSELEEGLRVFEGYAKDIAAQQLH